MRRIILVLSASIVICHGHGAHLTSERLQWIPNKKHHQPIAWKSQKDSNIGEPNPLTMLALLLLAVRDPASGWGQPRSPCAGMFTRGVADVACTAAMCVGSEASRPVRPEIILFGDSITQQSFAPGGWGAALVNAYSRHADVTLRGYSGYNTRWALQIVPRIFRPDAPAPMLITVLLGANDANLPAPLQGQPESASRQHVPLDEYIDNLRKILEVLRSMGDGSARILLITPPPVDTDKWQEHCVRTYGVTPIASPNRNFETTKCYADACIQLGIETDTPTLDLHSAVVACDNWPSLLRDGLHPNEEGGKVIAREVLNAIKTHFPNLVPAWYPEDGTETGKLPQDFPDHKAIDHENNNVEGSFAAHAKRKQQS